MKKNNLDPKDIVFKRLYDHESIDNIVSYIKSKIESSSEPVRIYIGSDSQNFLNSTQFASVVILHYGNSGGHVLYTKERIPRMKDMHERLWTEVQKSLDIAEFLYNSGLPRADYIDLDLNPDPLYRSNSIIRSAVGYLEGLGYKVRVKPDSAAATYCADSICH